MKHGYLISVLVLVFAMSGCGYTDCEYKPKQKQSEPANIDIGEVKSMYKGRPINVNDDIVISGRVTANDFSGNFYRSFIIEDNSGAIEVQAGLYNLHNKYAEGRIVSIKAQGLTIGSYNEMLQIGFASPEGGGFQTDYISYKAILDDYISVGDDFRRIEAMELKYHEFNKSKCGRLVVINGLEFAEEFQMTWAIARDDENEPESGYRLFADGDGNEVVVFTSGYADFASEWIPTGRLSIKGILSYSKTPYGERFNIKMRSKDDYAEF